MIETKSGCGYGAQDGQRRPHLEAHDRALRLPVDALVADLRDQLGGRVVAVLAGVVESRAVPNG